MLEMYGTYYNLVFNLSLIVKRNSSIRISLQHKILYDSFDKIYRNLSLHINIIM